MACNVKLEFNVAEIRSSRQVLPWCSLDMKLRSGDRFASSFTRFLTH
jgi:hypothetical protein